MKFGTAALFLTLALLPAPLAVEAQPTAKVYRIGYLGTIPPLPHIWGALVEGLRERGYVEGRNIVFERRFSEGRAERVPTLAAELVQSKVDVILSAGGTARALQEATTTIPIVMVVAGDPLGQGLVPSLARPGGNVTGLASVVSWDINGKRLELLKEIAAHISRVGVLYSTLGVTRGQDATFSAIFKEFEAAAKVLRVQLVPALAETPEQLQEAFAAIRRERADAILVGETGLNFRQRHQIVAFAASNRLPTVFAWRESVDDGGLISYGVSFADLFRRAATYVERILKGARPADLPVEQPTRFELIINLKTAKGLGLTIPPSVLIRADQVIE